MLFLHDRRLRVDIVTLQGIRQLGVFASMDICAVPASEPTLLCHLIHCDFEFETHREESLDSDEEYKAWRSRNLESLGLSDISLAEARSPARRSGMDVIAVLFGPARFLNVSCLMTIITLVL